MLRHFGGWDNDLSARYVVVWQEDDFQKISNSVVTVDLLRNTCNEFNDSFGVVVTWSSLSTDADDSWDKFALSLVSWGIKNGKISVDDIKDVHKLSLVFMNSLNLNIEHSVDWDIISSSFFDPICEFLFILIFDLDEMVLELSIRSIWNQLLQVVEGCDPFIDTTKSITD